MDRPFCCVALVGEDSACRTPDSTAIHPRFAASHFPPDLRYFTSARIPSTSTTRAKRPSRVIPPIIHPMPSICMSSPRNTAKRRRAPDGRRLVIRLALRNRHDHIRMMMGRRPSRRLLALLLGVLVALGMSFSAVQASGMAVKMTIASDMSGSGQGGCSGCTDDGGAQAGMCHPACTVAAVAVLPSGPVVATAQVLRLPPSSNLVSSGRVSSPDPSPPRAG